MYSDRAFKSEITEIYSFTGAVGTCLLFCELQSKIDLAEASGPVNVSVTV